MQRQLSGIKFQWQVRGEAGKSQGGKLVYPLAHALHLGRFGHTSVQVAGHLTLHVPYAVSQTAASRSGAHRVHGRLWRGSAWRWSCRWGAGRLSDGPAHELPILRPQGQVLQPQVLLLQAGQQLGGSSAVSQVLQAATGLKGTGPCEQQGNCLLHCLPSCQGLCEAAGPYMVQQVCLHDRW